MTKKIGSNSFTFDDDDVWENEHHDGLVILLTVSNCLLKWVIVDGGSLANILFKSALVGIGLDERGMTNKSTVLVGDTQQTLGEIVFPTYAKSVNLKTKFNVLDCPSA